MCCAFWNFRRFRLRRIPKFFSLISLPSSRKYMVQNRDSDVCAHWSKLCIRTFDSAIVFYRLLNVNLFIRICNFSAILLKNRHWILYPFLWIRTCSGNFVYLHLHTKVSDDYLTASIYIWYNCTEQCSINHLSWELQKSRGYEKRRIVKWSE